LWRNERGAFLLCACSFLLVPTLLRLFTQIAGPREWEKVTILRLDAILFGVLLVYITRESPKVLPSLRRTWPVGIAVVLAATLYLSVSPPSEIKDTICRGYLFSFISISMCLIVGAASTAPAARRWIAVPVSAISRWSYSLYLCHGIVNSYSKGVLKALHLDLDPESLGRMGFVWACSIALSALLYRFFERPLMNCRKPDRGAEVTEIGVNSRAEGLPLAA
jgi:peptidoglycan/LPS O-acetylase OafA/YrhL